MAERKLPENLIVTGITICDNSINRYGWRLLVAGIDLSSFLKNPVGLLQHDTHGLPVAKWFNVRVEDDKLVGDCEFDRNDDEAVKLYWKYIDKFMNAVSLNIIPKEESDDAIYLLPGQKYSTITKSELLEVSFVTVPGNANAVKQLYEIKLSTFEGRECKLKILHKMEVDEKTVAELKAELEAQKKINVETLLLAYKNKGVLQEGEEEVLSALAMKDYDNVRKMLELRQLPAAKTEISGAKAVSFVNNLNNDAKGANGNKANERANWTYLDYYKKDMNGLNEMQQKEPDKYKRLEAEFINESQSMGCLTTAME